MITCCELALWITLGAFVVILSLLAMFFNYNLRLDARTVKLEKKNGHEQEQINQLKQEIELLKNKPKHEKMPLLPKKKSPA